MKRRNNIYNSDGRLKNERGREHSPAARDVKNENSGGQNKTVNARQDGEIDVSYSSLEVSDQFVFDVYRYALAGYGNNEIARLLNMNHQTMKKYIDENERVSEAVMVGREDAVANVSKALYDNAVGFYKEVEELKFNNKTGQAEKVKVERYFKPDYNAQKFFLQSKAPDKWGKSNSMEDLSQSLQLKKTEEINFKGIDMSDKDRMREALEKFVNGNKQE